MVLLMLDGRNVATPPSVCRASVLPAAVVRTNQQWNERVQAKVYSHPTCTSTNNARSAYARPFPTLDRFTSRSDPQGKPGRLSRIASSARRVRAARDSRSACSDQRGYCKHKPATVRAVTCSALKKEVNNKRVFFFSSSPLPSMHIRRIVEFTHTRNTTIHTKSVFGSGI